MENFNSKMRAFKESGETLDQELFSQMSEAYGQMSTIKPNRWIRKNIFNQE